MPLVISDLAIHEVAALPSAATSPSALLTYAGTVWFSDGTSWVNLGAAGSADWETITASQTAVSNVRYIMDNVATQELTIPASAQQGKIFALHARGADHRLVVNGNTIDHTGITPGNDILVDEGGTLVLAAVSTGVLRVINAANVSVAATAVNASDIVATKIGGATHNDLQSLLDLTSSAGHLDGGVITSGGSNLIDVSILKGLVRATDDDTSTLFPFEAPVEIGLSVPVNTIRYVYLDYNGGSPSVNVTATNDFNYRTQFPLGYVINEGGTLYIVNNPHRAGVSADRLAQQSNNHNAIAREDSLTALMLSSPSGLKVATTAGYVWHRQTRKLLAAVNTAETGTYDRYYRDGAGGWTKVSAQTDTTPTVYDNNTGTPVTLATGKWSTKWWYIDYQGRLAALDGWDFFDTQAQCVGAAQRPNSMPLRLQAGALFIGRTVQRSNETTISTIISAFSTRIQGMQAPVRITVGPTAPSNPVLYDLWIDTN